MDYEYNQSDEKGAYRWATVGGKRIKIYEKLGLSESMKESGKFSKKEDKENNEEERNLKIEKLTKELKEMEQATVEKEVLAVVDEKGNKKYIGRSNSGGIVLTNDEKKALVSTNENGIAYQKKLQEKGYTAANDKKIEKKSFSYSDYENKKEELNALKSGFNNVSEFREHKEKVKQNYINSKKDKLENSYIYSQKRKNDDGYNPFYQYEDRESTFYNTNFFEEVIKRKAQQLMNVEEVHHSSKSGSKFSTSIYLRNKDTGVEVRISNHYLPDTAERQYKRSLTGGATRWDKELVLTQPEMENIANLKTEKEFTKYLKDLFS